VPVQLERIVKKANTKPSDLSMAVEDACKTRQDVTIKVAYWNDAGQCLFGCKL
jgi:hypothetical protein